MKTNTRLILLICLLLYLCSCGRRPYPQSLIVADSLASVQPDSAITLLQSLKKNISTESEATQMYYQLLCIKANDKAYIQHTSDSLILPILHYYIKKNDKQHLPEAYYYAGRVYRDLGDAPQALDYFQKAIEKMQNNTDYKLISKIYSQTGTLFLYQDMYSEALKVFRKAYQYNVLAKDSMGIAFNLRDIGRTFNRNADSALYYYQKAYHQAQKLNNQELTDIIQSEIASIYIQLKEFDLAKDALKSSANILSESNQSAIYAITANLYYQTNNIDSASYYYRKILSCGTVYAKQASYKGLAEIALKRHEAQAALTYIDRYLTCTDSVQKLTDTKTISRMRALYNYQSKEKENNKLRATNEEQKFLITYIAIILIIIVAFTAIYIEYSKRKRLQMKVQLNKLETLKEEQYLKSAHFIEENEKQIKILEEKIQALQEINTNQGLSLQAKKEQIISINKQIEAEQREQNLAENSLRQSPIYKFFQQAAMSNSAKISPEDWQALQDIIDNTYKNFTSRLYSIYTFSEIEFRICFLIKINISVSGIALLTGRSKSAIVSARKRMYAKVFQQPGTTEEWDTFIQSL